MEIKIVGAGCDKCDALYANTLEAAQQIGGDIQVIKVEDLMEMVMMGIMKVPAVVINGKNVFAGSVLSTDKLIELINREK